MSVWQSIETEPSDDSEIWISDGVTVWLGTAHKDGSLRLPSRSRCKFWMPAFKPAPPPQKNEASV
jgi:hypothetical protein